MKTLTSILLTLFAAGSMAQSGESTASIAESRGRNPVGLQLYSLRDQFANDVPGTLDKVRDFGFKEVELAGTYGLAPEKFKAELDARGLKPVAGHFPYDRYRTDVEGIIREAKILGLQYVGCAWINHEGAFDEQECRAAIAVFNRAGEALGKEGIRFYYHIHGYEFVPYGEGTLFDLMMREADARHVTFQMDVFWAAHAGQDPVALLKKHRGRWELTHLKGMKESTPTGLLTGHSDVTNNVPLGEGKIDYLPFLRAAEEAGVKWHFIEDESPLVEEQIPKSLSFLRSANW